MAKPRVIIADTEVSYVIPLQLKFVEDFFEMVDLEIITDKEYFNEKFTTPQRVDVLIVSEELFEQNLQRHNITNIFLMTEQAGSEQADIPGVTKIFKYTSIKEIFNEIISKSADVLNVQGVEKKETKIVLVYSACGGVGKTTVAMGISAGLAQKFKNVLYINAAHLQTFQHMLENSSAITSNGDYLALSRTTDSLYSDIKHLIRKEIFSYLPPFKAALMSLGLSYSIYKEIILSAKKSNEFDYIVVDTDVTFDEKKAELLDVADKVIVVTNQTMAAVSATNLLVANINGINKDKYVYVCNDFKKDESNALILPTVSLKFAIGEYVEHFTCYEQMSPTDISENACMQRVSFLIM